MKTTNKYAFTTEIKTNEAQSKLTVLIPVDLLLVVISSASAALSHQWNVEQRNAGLQNN